MLVALGVCRAGDDVHCLAMSPLGRVKPGVWSEILRSLLLRMARVRSGQATCRKRVRLTSATTAAPLIDARTLGLKSGIPFFAELLRIGSGIHMRLPFGQMHFGSLSSEHAAQLKTRIEYLKLSAG